MEPHQHRVLDEKTLLDDKIGKLEGFLGGEIVLKLPAAEQQRLARQLGVMREYSSILGERIEAF